jgi:hypothetical protein
MPLPRPRPTLAEKRVRRRNQLLAFASFLLAEAQNDGDRCLAFLVIQRALDSTRSGRLGPRGRYNAAQSDDFFDLLLTEFSDRKFRAWLR